MSVTYAQCKEFFLSQQPLIKRLRDELPELGIYRCGRNMIFIGEFHESPYDDQLITREVVMRGTFDGKGWSLSPIKIQLDFGDEGVAEEFVISESDNDINQARQIIADQVDNWKFPADKLVKANKLLDQIALARGQILSCV